MIDVVASPVVSSVVAQLTPTAPTTAPPSCLVTGLCTAPRSLHISVQYRLMGPELILIGGALFILTVASLLPKRSRPALWVALTVITGLAAGGWAAALWDQADATHARLIVGNALAFDRYTVFFMVLVSIAVVLGALISDSYLRRERLVGPEFYVLSLLSASGAMIMAEANDLLVVFLGLEILSIALYVMAGYHRRREVSGEAAM